jgi:hypothetical protein
MTDILIVPGGGIPDFHFALDHDEGLLLFRDLIDIIHKRSFGDANEHMSIAGSCAAFVADRLPETPRIVFCHLNRSHSWPEARDTVL